MSLETHITRSWYKKLGWTWALAPLLLISAPVIYGKRRKFLRHPEASYQASIPVVIVGNITVGGTGKSPMVIALAQHIKNMGLRPGIVSRGHKREGQGVVLVTANSAAKEVGDEPLMLHRRAQCPVAVCANRVEAVKALESSRQVDVIISDDGLQHYQMGRDVEIAMIDAKRQLGNGALLPVGPLREPSSRLASVDFCFSIGAISGANNGLGVVHEGKLEIASLVSLNQGHTMPLDALQKDLDWLVLAGIGNPERFVSSLEACGLARGTQTLFFPDHHEYQLDDLPKDRKIIMTEKDAVKIEPFATSLDDWWYVTVDLELPESFTTEFTKKIEHILSEKSYE
ncbi:tetraacyldisaccharide 4'-kinase [Rhodanobacter aciditrophus]|uniref:Tetraacyldisaccharide 4'-kinase n=1 Tax=Rhodanobacter aciditrophus TaxID=1623218 RepID=A0ABW4B245_9GAMM